MIIKTRRKNESIFKRLVKKANPKSSSSVGSLLTQELFESELIKEAFRSNRRSTDCEFALITFEFSDYQATDRKLAGLIAGFRSRLRVSDVIGWFDLRLAVLLPETKKQGALLVANQLAAISLDHGVKVETHVAIYPWDDTLAAVTDSLSANAENATAASHSDHQDDNDNDYVDDHNDADGSSTSLDATTYASTSSGYDRTDGPHEGGKSYLAHGGPQAGVATATQTQPPATQMGLADKLRNDLPFNKAIHGTGNPFQVLSDKTPKWKRGLDIVGSATGLILLSPVFLMVAVAIKISCKGPVFFVQKREGKDGREFGILKFRTMKVNAEAEQELLRKQSEQDGPAFKLKNDPRVTFVGKYLRKSCLDELPQLYNVLVGEMSLVGPRPLPVGESKQCSTWQRRRLSILPGLTCIWQAHGGRDIKFSEWMRMDMEYIRKRSLCYDLKLIFETAFLAVLHRGSV